MARPRPRAFHYRRRRAAVVASRAARDGGLGGCGPAAADVPELPGEDAAPECGGARQVGQGASSPAPARVAFPTRPPSVADPSPPCVSFLQAFIASFGDRTGATVDAEADSRRIQEFLRATESAFRGHPAWRGASEGDLEASGEGLEKYLMTKLHPSTFAVTPDDQRADSLLSRRVAALRTFIRPEHLDIPERFRVEASLRLAEDELVKVNLLSLIHI